MLREVVAQAAELVEHDRLFARRDDLRGGARRNDRHAAVRARIFAETDVFVGSFASNTGLVVHLLMGARLHTDWPPAFDVVGSPWVPCSTYSAFPVHPLAPDVVVKETAAVGGAAAAPAAAGAQQDASKAG